MRIVDIPTDPTPKKLIKPKVRLHKLLRKVDRLIRAVAELDRRYDHVMKCPLARARELTEPERFGPECKVVRWHGRTFTFSSAQAEVVRYLRRCHREGTPRVHEKTMIDRLRPEADEVGQKVRMEHLFRGHGAIGYMVHIIDGWWWLGKP